MSSPATDTWWTVFHKEHGRDSEEERAFLGYLYTHDVPGDAPPEALASAYGEFLTFVDASRTRDEAHGPQPKAVEPPPQVVPRAWFSNPDVQKPQTAATRPPELRDTEAAARGSVLTDPSVASQPPGPPTLDPSRPQEVPGSEPSMPQHPSEQQPREEEEHRRGRRG